MRLENVIVSHVAHRFAHRLVLKTQAVWISPVLGEIENSLPKRLDLILELSPGRSHLASVAAQPAATRTALQLTGKVHHCKVCRDLLVT